MTILEVIEQAKAEAIANGSYALPNPHQILLKARLSTGYFHQRSEKAKAAKAAYQAAQEALTIRKFTPLAAAKLAVYDRLETALKKAEQREEMLRRESDRLILELALFRQFEAEWLKARREISRFTQQQKEAA